MRTFDYIEDYIEFIAGYREINGTKLSTWNGKPSPVSLARYDVGIVESFAHQLDDGKAFTDKQAELAMKIVLKYRKQLSSLEVEIPEPVPGYRLGIRQVDRTKRISIIDNKLIIKFPYDTDLITLMKVQLKESQGSVEFDTDNKVWCLGITENNINYAITMGRANNFEIADEVQTLFDKIIEAEQTPFVIELVKDGEQYRITNCPDSLDNYILEKLGGYGLNNLLTLVDQSAVLGYTVSEDILHPLVHEYGEEFVSWMVSRTLSVDKDKLQDLIDYGRKTKRTPTYVYNTEYPTSQRDNDVYYLNRSVPDLIEPKLLISASEMMIGTRKQMWTTNAEKVFYLK
jgi:hypothetical protein